MIRGLIALCLAAFGGAALAQEGSALDAAYQKEFAYLVAEKRALEERLAELRATSAGQIAASEAELERLEARSIAAELEEDRAESLIEAIDREVDGMTEASDALEATLVAARSTLERDGFALGEPAADFPGVVAQLGAAYGEGAARIDEGRLVRTAPGSFFLLDGTQVEGSVTRVGQIAAYGVSERGAGALVPAGEGHLRVWSAPADGAARAVATGAASGSLPVYLFESMEKRVEEPPDKGLAATMRAGGVVGWVIVVLGGIAGVLVLIRGGSLLLLGRGDDALVHAVGRAIEAGDLARARTLVTGAGSLPRVLAAMLPHVESGREETENAATEAMLRETPRLERFGTAISVIAAVAPLLGLLGTVTGMITTFDIITTFGTGDPKMLSSGISEALVTTEFGLIVAIPGLLFGNLLTAWATSISDAIERGALHVANLAAELDDDDSDAPNESGLRAVPRSAHG